MDHLARRQSGMSVLEMILATYLQLGRKLWLILWARVAE